jgi:hypothetical protein
VFFSGFVKACLVDIESLFAGNIARDLEGSATRSRAPVRETFSMQQAMRRSSATSTAGRPSFTS